MWLAFPQHHQGCGSISHAAQVWQDFAAASHLPATSLSPLSASGPPPCVEQLTLNALCMSPVRMPFRQTPAHARDASPNCQLTSSRSLIFICSDSYLLIFMHSGPRAPAAVPPLHPKPGRTPGRRRGIQFRRETAETPVVWTLYYVFKNSPHRFLTLDEIPRDRHDGRGRVKSTPGAPVSPEILH